MYTIFCAEEESLKDIAKVWAVGEPSLSNKFKLSNSETIPLIVRSIFIGTLIALANPNVFPSLCKTVLDNGSVKLNDWIWACPFPLISAIPSLAGKLRTRSPGLKAVTLLAPVVNPVKLTPAPAPIAPVNCLE